MEFAKSLINGKIFNAKTVSYADTTSLRLVCIECHQKVFKSVRTFPNTLHFFCHHPGVGIGCNLYNKSHYNDNNSFPIGNLDSKGQELKEFLANIKTDINGFFQYHQIITSSINRTKFNKCEVFAETVLQKINPSLYLDGLSASVNNLTSTKIQIKSQAEIIKVFYKNEKSRFIDKILITWIIYYFDNDLPNLDINKLCSSLITHPKLLTTFTGILIVGLACYYQKIRIPHIKDEFLRSISILGSHYQLELAKSRANHNGVLPGFHDRVSTAHNQNTNRIKLINEKEWVLENSTLFNKKTGTKINSSNFKFVSGPIKGYQIWGHGNIVWISSMKIEEV